MEDLRLKVRKKIYTSGSHIVDIQNNNNAIIVILGKMSNDKLKGLIDNFLENILKSQISNDKISFVQIDGNDMAELPKKLAQTVKGITFKHGTNNELYISFVTIMDDDIYKQEHKIDIVAIEELKSSALGGYAVEFFYDFYGIFTSAAKYSNRENARKTICNFLNYENGGRNIRKKIYHQACPGDDYYRSAKAITFMILVNLIKQLDQHTILDSEVKGNDYSWTTFSFSEKNLTALVVYESIKKLLENQRNGTETVAAETICQSIRQALVPDEANMKKLAPSSDIAYIPILVRKRIRQLTIFEKILNIFKKDKIKPVEYRKENEEENIQALLNQQEKVFSEYVNNITDAFKDGIIVNLIRLCTVMESIDNIQNEALIYKSLLSVKRDLLIQDRNLSSLSMLSKEEDYQRKYNEILMKAEANIIDGIIKYFDENRNSYVEQVQNHWNKLNLEVHDLITDFAAFHNHFEGIGELISGKTVNLLCTYDDILDKIDIQSVIKAINKNTDIYSNVLASYFVTVQEAGDIAKRFGNRNIVPAPENIAYYLFSASEVQCPDGLKLKCDEYWFRDHEIAILFTAKNEMDDCKNLPYQP